MYIILAVYPWTDAAVVACNLDKSTAIGQWDEYMMQGQRMEELSDAERTWMAKARVDMLAHGKTALQDSKVFYRMTRWTEAFMKARD